MKQMLIELLAIPLGRQKALHSHSAKSPKYGDISRWLTATKWLVIFRAALFGALTFPFFANAETPMELSIVTPTRMSQSLDETIADTTVLDEQDIRDSGAADIPSLLKNLAGVEFYQSGGIGKQGSLFLRGTNSSHVLVLLDGVRINSATTGATAIDQLMLDQVERIEVVRGNVSSLYGSEAIGGVVQIFTKRGKGKPAFNVSGGVGSHNTQRLAGGFGGEAGDTTFNVQASKNKTAGVSAIKSSIVSTVNPDNDGYDNTSLSGNVSHAFNSDNSLAASVFQSRGDVQFDNAFGATNDLDTGKSTLSKFSVASDNRLNDSWQSKLQLAQGTDDYQGYLNGVQSYYIKTNNRQISWQNTLAMNSFGSVLLGLENLDQHVMSDTPYTQTARKVNSLFAGYTGNYDAHQVQVNIRQDRYSDFGVADTGLLGYGYAMSDAWRATASISTAFKAPTFNDLYYPVAWGGNPNLQPEHSRNAEIGMHYTAEGQRIDAVYFDNRIRDLIAGFPSKNINQARSDGLELTYAGQFGDTGVKAALTSQNPHDVKTGQALLRRAKSFANLGVSQELGSWKVGGEWQYSGTREDQDINTGARTTLTSYSLANLTASYDISKKLRLSLRADNLFNKDYMLAYGYNTLGRTLFAGLNYQQ
jgi:vitamin B12 transporter